MRKLLKIVFLFMPMLISAQTNNSNCYVLKSDATGYDRNYEVYLNSITSEIATLLEQPNDFKVFDYGLYLQLTNMIGALEEVTIRIDKAAAKDSKFYMTITKIPSYDKIIERFDIKLRLPQTGVFACLNNTKNWFD